MSEQQQKPVGQVARSAQAGASVGMGVAAAYLVMAAFRIKYPDLNEQLSQVERDMALAFSIYVTGRLWSFFGDMAMALVHRLKGEK